MLELFDKNYSDEKIFIDINFVRLNKLAAHNINILRNYYKRSNIYISGNNIFNRLLETYYIPVDRDLTSYYETSIVRSKTASNYFGFTTPFNYGNVFNDELYINSTEIIISDMSDVNPDISKFWENVSPLKILSHNSSNIYLSAPCQSFENHGLVFAKLHIPLMLLQLKYYMLDHKRKGLTPTINGYITKYLLPNALFSQYDVTVFNLLYNSNFEITEQKYENKFHINIRNIDRFLNSAINKLTIKNKTIIAPYTKIIKKIPSVYYENFYEFNVIKDIVPTRQVTWALILSKLKITEYLISLNNSSNINTYYINKIKTDLKRLTRTRVLNNILPDNIYENIDQRINKILET